MQWGWKSGRKGLRLKMAHGGGPNCTVACLYRIFLEIWIESCKM